MANKIREILRDMGYEPNDFSVCEEFVINYLGTQTGQYRKAVFEYLQWAGHEPLTSDQIKYISAKLINNFAPNKVTRGTTGKLILQFNDVAVGKLFSHLTYNMEKTLVIHLDWGGNYQSLSDHLETSMMKHSKVVDMFYDGEEL